MFDHIRTHSVPNLANVMGDRVDPTPLTMFPNIRKFTDDENVICMAKVWLEDQRTAVFSVHP